MYRLDRLEGGHPALGGMEAVPLHLPCPPASHQDVICPACPPGDMLRDPQLVFGQAEAVVERLRQQQREQVRAWRT